MYCTNCGNHIPEDSKFCRYCGVHFSHKLSEADLQKTNPHIHTPPASNSQAAAYSQKPLNSKTGNVSPSVLIKLIIMGIVMLFIFVFIIIAAKFLAIFTITMVGEWILNNFGVGAAITFFIVICIGIFLIPKNKSKHKNL